MNQIFGIELIFPLDAYKYRIVLCAAKTGS